jgi:hypothetical protein
MCSIFSHQSFWPLGWEKLVVQKQSSLWATTFLKKNYLHIIYLFIFIFFEGNRASLGINRNFFLDMESSNLIIIWETRVKAATLLMVALAQVYGKGQLSFGFGMCTSDSWAPIQACSLLLPELERRFGNLVGLKNHPMQMSPTLGNCRQQKSSNERPTKTNMHICFKT